MKNNIYLVFNILLWLFGFVVWLFITAIEIKANFTVPTILKQNI